MTADRMRSDGWKDLALRSGACFLILWAPFFAFSSHRGHPISNVALAQSVVVYAVPALVVAFAMGPSKGGRRVALFTLLVCLFLDLAVERFDGIFAWLGAAVLAAIFWALREHLALILFVAFATILATSVVRMPDDAARDHRLETRSEANAPPAATGPIPTGASTPPGGTGRVVHLVLDAFAGPIGLPDDLPGGPELDSEVRAFFARAGFQLHPNAISEYAASRASISGILNFAAGPDPERRHHGKRPYVLDRNAAFEALAARGFALRVHQSTYMDFCSAAPVELASCFTYRYDGTDWLRRSELDDFDQMSVLLGMILNHGGMLESAWKGWRRLRRTAGGFGIRLPALMRWDGHVSPIAAFAALDHLTAEILASPDGTAHFAHLLVPHGPFVYDAQCRIAPDPLGWRSARPLHERDQTAASRERRYALYFDQVRCTLRRLDAFFTTLRDHGLWSRTEIVVHGDHGSRIHTVAPRADRRDRLGDRDLEDAFGTLFAVKSARAPDLSLDRTMPISKLLARVMRVEAAATGGDDPGADAGPRADDDDERADAGPVVYLEGGDDAPWTALVWPVRP